MKFKKIWIELNKETDFTWRDAMLGCKVAILVMLLCIMIVLLNPEVFGFI